MRIALFTDTYPPQINGVAASTYILRNELEKHGHEVYVVTTYKGSGKHKWDDDHKILRLAGVQLKFLYGYVMTSPFHVSALEEVRKLNLDVIHAQTEFGVGIFARICAKQLKIPLVSTYHTTYEDYTHYVNFINSRKVDEIAKIGVAKLSRLYGDSSIEVIAPSIKTKQMLEGYHVRREINVIPTGLELDKFDKKLTDKDSRNEIRRQYGFTENDKLIIYVGRLAEEKALDLVVRGFSEALKQGIQVKLLIVGDGPDFDRLNQLAEELKVTESVKFAGAKPRDEIPALYHSADAFISASLSETQGMTFIEALASGLPLFARYDDVLKELLIPEKTGWFFYDEKDLPKYINEFLSLTDDQYQEISNQCIEQVQPYSSETFYERVIQVYSNTIQQYHDQYSIVDVKVKDTLVQLYLISDKKEELRIQVSLDDYYNMGMRKDGTLTKKQVEDLLYREKGSLAYQSCLRKLEYKDRSRKEIYDWLTQNTECDIYIINRIVEKLEKKGYINDERFCEDQINSLKAALNGKDKIIRTLTKKGIPYEMIEQKLNERKDDEEDNAVAYAEKILSSCKNDSVKKSKNYVYTRLISRGYRYDLAKKVSEKLDYTKVETKELDNLYKCCAKAKKRYERKYQGNELRNHVFRYCMAQGYPTEDIYVTMDEMEW
jgi:1,2-diacylglycerol 3-alpha-glucosyltransferase